MADIDNSIYNLFPQKTDSSRLGESFWQGPADGTAPGCVVKQGPWETVTKSNMSTEDIEKMMQIIRDASGNESMEIQPYNYDNASKDSVKDTIAKETKHLPAEQQKEVAEGVQAILNRDPEKIQQFMEKATPAEREAFFKCLKDLGYNVEYTPPSAAEQMRIGGTLHEHYKISKPGSILASGINITMTSNPSTGPMDRPRARVSLEK